MFSPTNADFDLAEEIVILIRPFLDMYSDSAYAGGLAVLAICLLQSACKDSNFTPADVLKAWDDSNSGLKA